MLRSFNFKILVVVCGVWLGGVVGNTWGDVRYSVTQLPCLQGDRIFVAASINESNQIAGYSTGPTSSTIGILDNGSFTAIPLLPGASYGVARDINDSGVVVGDMRIGSDVYPFIWDKTNGTRSLGVLPGHSGGYATCVNNLGQIGGFTDDQPEEGWIWDSTNGMRPLGGFVSDINDIGQVVGYAKMSHPDYSAFLWDNTNGMQELAVPTGYATSVAISINESGQIVGRAERPDGQEHAALWNAGEMTELDTHPGETSYSIARSINESGQVFIEVGGGPPFIWDSINLMQDLSTLVPENSAPNLSTGGGGSINDRGYIVSINYLFSPVPEPSTLVLLLAGAGAFLAYSWRKWPKS